MANPYVPHWDDKTVRFDAGWRWPSRAEILAAKNERLVIRAMKHRRWYPRAMSEQTVWLENFRSEAGKYVTPLGLNQAAVDAAVAGARFLIYYYSQWLPGVRAFAEEGTTAGKLLATGTGSSVMALPVFTPPALPTGVVATPPGALERIFKLVEEIKRASAYTAVVGSLFEHEGGH
jgi:hypothetical protein